MLFGLVAARKLLPLTIHVLHVSSTGGTFWSFLSFSSRSFLLIWPFRTYTSTCLIYVHCAIMYISINSSKFNHVNILFTCGMIFFSGLKDISLILEKPTFFHVYVQLNEKFIFIPILSWLHEFCLPSALLRSHLLC